MGHTESKPEQFANFIKSYQKREEVNDDRYGNVTIYNHAHNPTDLIMVKDRWTNTPPDAAELAGMTNTRVQNNHKNLAKMLQYGVKEDNQMCSTFYKHFMAFEYYPKNVEQEIEDKNKNPNHEFYSKYYSEPEVWYIIDGLISLLMSFKERGYHHGDIQPKNIFIDPHGFIKMVDNSLVNYGKTGYLKMIFQPGYKSALSPQLLKAFQSKELHPNHDAIKSDIFSIGITLLCTCLNTSIDNYYNWSVPSLNVDNIRRSYDEMSRLGFSHQLISTIQGFLDDNEDRRTSLEEIYAFLSKYQEAIRKGQMNFGGVPPPTNGPQYGYGAANGAFQNSVLPGQPGFATSTYPNQPITQTTTTTTTGPVVQGGTAGYYAGPQKNQIVQSRYP